MGNGLRVAEKVLEAHGLRIVHLLQKAAPDRT
jgi:hypothetical protein